jgi:hypothetical protein
MTMHTAHSTRTRRRTRAPFSFRRSAAPLDRATLALLSLSCFVLSAVGAGWLFLG